jgi:hypothetical protein
MSNLFEDVAQEIKGALVLGFIGLIFIFILVTLGDATGQNEIANQAIQAILILIFGIGLPIGIISLIKWLGGFSNGNHY